MPNPTENSRRNMREQPEVIRMGVIQVGVSQHLRTNQAWRCRRTELRECRNANGACEFVKDSTPKNPGKIEL